MSARWRVAAAACVLALLGGASAGCSVVDKINKIRHVVDSNRRTIKSFTEGLKTAETIPFQATYVTTGDAPTTVVYAVHPPNRISFSEASSGSDASATRLIANPSGEYSCTRATPGGQWSCDKLGKASAGAQNALFAIYTPQHWVTFLHVLSIGAGLAGAKVRTSTRTINGFSMNCVNLFTKGEGTSTICTTDLSILGYVKVAAQSTSFELKSYTPTPPDSAFELPPGATVANS